METPDNKPKNPEAFAMGFANDTNHFIQCGMTLRDYFAAKAMQTLICNATSIGKLNGITIAQNAYNMADAMLAERSKP